MGGGTTVGVYQNGKIIDIINDEEGPFSPERAGGLPAPQVIDMAFSGEYDIKALKKKLKNSSGLQAYLGTKDARTVEKMIDDGDEKMPRRYIRRWLISFQGDRRAGYRSKRKGRRDRPHRRNCLF